MTHGNVEEIDDLLRRFPGGGDFPAPAERESDAAHTVEAGAPEADSAAMLVGDPATSEGGGSPKSRWSGRNSKTAAMAACGVVLIAIIAVVAYLLVGGKLSGSGANKRATSTSPTSSPVPVAALDGLLLSPDQINTAMGTTGMGIRGTYTALFDDTAAVADANCRAIDAVQETSSYGGSGWTALRRQTLQQPPEGDNYDFFAKQGVASFPSANAATALFTTSAQRWSDCSNRRYTNTGPKGGGWTTGPLSNTAGTLSITMTEEGANGWNCQRALTVTNNVAIDTVTCSYKPSDAAANIAHQIAAKVAKQ